MQLYSKGKNSLFWSQIDNLNQYVHNKDFNVVPYTPGSELRFIDFYPTLAVGPVRPIVQVYVNDSLYTTCKVVDALGTIYFDKIFDYGSTRVVIKYNGNQIGAGSFVAVNQYLYYTVYASNQLDRLVDKLKIRNDLYLSEVRDDNLYNNFGYLMKAPKPPDFSFAEYREMLDSFMISYINGSTVLAIMEAVKDVTKVYPTILPQGSGWKVRRFNKYRNFGSGYVNRASIKEQMIRYQNSLLVNNDYIKYNHATSDPETPVIAYYYVAPIYKDFKEVSDFTLAGTTLTWSSVNKPANSTYYISEYTTDDTTMAGAQVHEYAGGVPANARAKVPIVVYSGSQNNFTIKIQVNNSKRTVTNEDVAKGQVTGGTDKLQNRYLTATTVLISGYTENTHFTVDRWNGTITWLAGAQPSFGSIYQVTYEYYVKEAVENIVENIKPAHIRVKYSYV